MARYAPTGSTLAADGHLLLAGGEGLASSEIYRFATVRTDMDDYLPGQTVYVSASGWQPNETVTFGLRELPAEHEARAFSVTADENGNITNALLLSPRTTNSACGSSSRRAGLLLRRRSRSRMAKPR